MPWTSDLITDMIVTAYRRPGGNVALPGDVDKAVGFQRRFAGVGVDDWTFLLHRCRWIALGTSINEQRDERGWPRARFEDGWRRAAAAIANGLNAERVNTAKLIAGAEAEERLERQGKIPVPHATSRLLTS